MNFGSRPGMPGFGTGGTAPSMNQPQQVSNIIINRALHSTAQ